MNSIKKTLQAKATTRYNPFSNDTPPGLLIPTAKETLQAEARVKYCKALKQQKLFINSVNKNKSEVIDVKGQQKLF